jgi:hypothetical protein
VHLLYKNEKKTVQRKKKIFFLETNKTFSELIIVIAFSETQKYITILIRLQSTFAVISLNIR